MLRNSSYLFASYVLGALLTFVTAKLLGVASFGALGTIIVFTSSINRLFSFRMGEMVVKYMGEPLARQDTVQAAAAVKAAMLVESVTSVLAFTALVLLAPLGALYFVKDAQAAPLFGIYGLAILANIVNETSTGVLQVTNHYKSQALINFIQTVLVGILLGLAAVYHAGLFEVLLVYLLGKVILGLGPVLLAFYWLPKSLGRAWWRAPLSVLPPWREIARFTVSNNFSGTVNLIARDSEQPIVSFFFGTAAAGYYKIAQAIMSIITMVINPFITTTYPEITRTLAQRNWLHLRRLLRRVTLISATWTALVAVGLLLVGKPVLFQYWTVFGHRFSLLAEYAPAYPIVLVLLAGYGFANIFFWSRPLLLTQGLAGYALKVGFWAMLAKVALIALILKQSGTLMEAVLLSGYLIVTVGFSVWRGLREVRKAEQAGEPVLQGEPV